MNKVAVIAAAIALGTLPSCKPPRNVEGAIDQDINAARNVGPVSGGFPQQAEDVVAYIISLRATR